MCGWEITPRQIKGNLCWINKVYATVKTTKANKCQFSGGMIYEITVVQLVNGAKLTQT